MNTRDGDRVVQRRLVILLQHRDMLRKWCGAEGEVHNTVMKQCGASPVFSVLGQAAAWFLVQSWSKIPLEDDYIINKCLHSMINPFLHDLCGNKSCPHSTFVTCWQNDMG